MDWPTEAASAYLRELGENHYDDGLEMEGMALVGAAAMGLAVSEQAFRDVIRKICEWDRTILDETVVALRRRVASPTPATPARVPGPVAWRRLR